MTLFAGIVTRDDSSVPQAMREALIDGISRHQGDRPLVFEDAYSCCVKVDIGAFGASGHVTDVNGAFSLLAGEPLLADDTASHDRHEDLRTIHDYCTQGNLTVLRGATGTFCVAHYRPATRTLRLIADKLAIRPIYYWNTPRYVVFATALRVLETLPALPRTLDLRAVMEMSAFGYPLGDRTPYAEMQLMRAGETLEVAPASISRSFYWRWDEVPVVKAAEPIDARHAYDMFMRGVIRRLGNERTTAAYLSGGLDSRCVAAALVASGARVHTFNFARPGTQDYYLGNEAGVRLGTVHHAVPKPLDDPISGWNHLMTNAWKATRDSLAATSDAQSPEWPAHPQLVWSGEGGSVALGHVHMHKRVVDRLRAGSIDDAIDEFLSLEGFRIPLKMFRAGMSTDIASILREGIREELAQIPAAEPGRRFFLYVLQNDQRRKLASHFESIDLDRLELQLPFFDGDFLTSIVQVPLDDCLGHQFYSRWMAHFGPMVTSVPWQAYPGHDQCPLPVPGGLSYQWNTRYLAAERSDRKLLILRRAFALLTARDFPSPILSRRHLMAAVALHATGSRNYEYVIDAACLCHRYWQNCGSSTFAPSSRATAGKAIAQG